MSLRSSGFNSPSYQGRMVVLLDPFRRHGKIARTLNILLDMNDIDYHRCCNRHGSQTTPLLSSQTTLLLLPSGETPWWATIGPRLMIWRPQI